MFVDQGMLLKKIKDLCDSGVAPSTIRISREFPGLHDWDLRVRLRNEADLGTLESCSVGCQKYWRPAGSDAVFPLSGSARIINILQKLNREKAGGATMTDILRATGFSKTFTLDWLKRLDAAGEVRVYQGAHGVNYYVCNTPEFDGIELDRSDRHRPFRVTDGWSLDKLPPSFSPITRTEIRQAKGLTRVGDEVTIRMSCYGQSAKTINTTVSMRLPYLCVFENGISVSWGDMAMYYRRPNRVLVIEE